MNIYEVEKDNWIFHDPNLSRDDFDILDQAIERFNNGNYDIAETLLKKLIKESPSNIDAFHHLSMLYDEAGMELEAYLCCRESVRIGLDAIPKEFNWRKSKLNWYSHDNRPFMRAYHSLGLWHQRRNETEQAERVLSRLLAVCPDDGLGVRYLLPKLWLEKGDYLSIVRLCKSYADDVAPEITYTYPLALALMGESKKAVRALKKAEESLPLVAKELRKRRHTKPKSSLHGYITLGGADQAYGYWQQYGEFWKGNTEAMSLLSNG